MAQRSWQPILQFIRRLGGPAGAATPPGDGELLRRFAQHRDESAFAALMDRHGPMVWATCTRLLPGPQDAEDAFQATFVVLARKAGTLRRPEGLGPWLHGVARRTALKARVASARRLAREGGTMQEPAVEASPEVVWRELRPVLDEEVDRLPDRYRVPFVLCYLEGLTTQEAAQRLGCPKGTVDSRLSRARARLRSRLTRRGLTLSAGTLATAMAENAGAAVVPPGVAEAALRLSILSAAGALAPSLTTPALVLAQGVLHNMFLTKLKLAIAALLVLTLAGTGAGMFTLAGPGDTPAAVAQDTKAPPAAQKESRPAAKKDNATKPGDGKETPTKARLVADMEVGNLLADPIDFTGFDDPKTKLAEALDKLAAMYGFQYGFNEKAFLEGAMPDPGNAEIAQAGPIQPLKGSLRQVLDRVLARVPVAEGATFLVRKGLIEVTTIPAVRVELGIDPSQPLPPLVTQYVNRVTLTEALRSIEDSFGVNIVLDPKAVPDEKEGQRLRARLFNVPVVTAVRILADMEDLAVVEMGNVLYVTSPEKAARLKKDANAAAEDQPPLFSEPVPKAKVSKAKQAKPEK